MDTLRNNARDLLLEVFAKVLSDNLFSYNNQCEFVRQLMTSIRADNNR